MDLLFRSSVKSIDKKAVFPIAYLIHSFLQNHNNAGSATICPDKIEFCKGIFFTVGKVSLSPYGIECRNGTIYYDGLGNFQYPHDNLFTWLVNALMQLKPGLLAKIPV